MRLLRTPILAVVAALAVACSSSSSNTAPDTSTPSDAGDDTAAIGSDSAVPGDSQPDGATDASTDDAIGDALADTSDAYDPDADPPLVVEPNATAMAVSFSLASDSSGTTPQASSTVTLTLEPPSTAHILFYDHSTGDSLAFEGTYAIDAGNLTVSFTDPDFTRSGTIAFDGTAPTYTFPFQTFASDPGTSTWNRDVVTLADNAQDLFDALSSAPTLSLDDRAARVLAYAQAYAAAHADVQAQALAAHTTAPPNAAPFWYLAPFITNTALNSDGTELIITYYGGSTDTIILYDLAPRTTAALTTSALASDPRVNLFMNSPARGNDDPSLHTAFFFGPFDSKRYYAHYPFGIPSDAEGTTYGFGADDQLDAMQSVLEGDGYTVKSIKDDAATVEALIDGLGGGAAGPAPGFVYLSTHGSDTGLIMTGELLDFSDGPATKAALQKVLTRLRGEGYGDLVDFGLDPGDTTPMTLTTACATRALNGKKEKACYVAVSPAFFTWLRQKRHVDFSKSLVMMATCLTDKTAAMREAVGARAYFAYNVSIPGPFAGATFQYFVKSLVKHTHTAEESYYNVLRVANGRQMIYPEDALFKNVVPEESPGDPHAVQAAFHGYFYDSTQPAGAQMTDYQKVGWLNTSGANPGSIWLLLFAGRWGQDATVGSNNLLTCWSGAWSAGNQGDPGTWCRDAAPGYAPSAQEVSYALYLLTGTASGAGLAPVSPLTPRWTMNDVVAP